MTLTESDLAHFRHVGHLTVPRVFDGDRDRGGRRGHPAWGESSWPGCRPNRKRAWYVDGGVSARAVLRKLDNPASSPRGDAAAGLTPALVSLVER